MKENESNARRVTPRSYEYHVSGRDMSTPYYAAYKASRNARQRGELPKTTVRPVAASYGTAPRDDSYYDAPSRRNEKAPKPISARRGFWAFIVMLFTLLYIAVPVLNYFQIGGLASVNKYFDLFDRVSLVEQLDEDGNPVVDDEGNTVMDAQLTNMGTEDIVMGFVKGLTPAKSDDAETEDGEDTSEEDTSEQESAEAAAEETDAADEAADAVADDTADAEEETQEEKHYFFYDEYMSKVGEAGTMQKIAYYGLPIVLALGVLIALIFFIRALVCLCTTKRRKLFIFSAIMMLVMTLLGVVFGFMCTGAEWSQFVSFVTFKNELSLQLGYGYVIMAGLSVLTLIASCFTFRSKKVVY